MGLALLESSSIYCLNLTHYFSQQTGHKNVHSGLYGVSDADAMREKFDLIFLGNFAWIEVNLVNVFFS